MNLSANFTLAELTASDTASRAGRVIMATKTEVRYLRELCITVLQPIREAFGPVRVTSGLRPLWLNTLIGSQPTSQHVPGQAADIKIHGVRPIEVARWIRVNAVLPADQCILEFPDAEFGGWVHVSIASEPSGTRRQYFTVLNVGGRPVDRAGFVEVAA